MKKKHRTDYINNDEFYDVLVEYLDACDKADLAGEEQPRIPEFIGHCFLLLAKNVGKASNFSQYTFLEEMQSDSVLNCVKYIRNFKSHRLDPETGELIKNRPFSYFTQYVINTFKQRIKDERKNMYSRYKMYQNFQIEEQLAGQSGACPPELNDISNQHISSYERDMEQEKERKRLNRLKPGVTLSDFYEEDV